MAFDSLSCTKLRPKYFSYLTHSHGYHVLGGWAGHILPFFIHGGGGRDNISIVLPLFYSKLYITDAGNEAIANIMKYILNINKYKILK